MATRGKNTLILLTLVLILGAAVYWYIASQIETEPLQKQRSFPILATTSPAFPKTEANINITSKGFLPATISIKKGAQVIWINQDSKPHQIASDPHPAHSLLPSLVEDEALTKGSSFTYTFEEVRNIWLP
ncbi:MAG: cupredoxin domain-containing protein [bacterium]|nr:cupredoxin domain-containing protein [bacterium]